MAQDLYTNKEIVCAKCRFPFTWTAGEQAFYASKSLKPPKFCRVCREHRRETNQGKIWGARIAMTDTETRQVLCSRCQAPASKELSERCGRAVCSACAGMPPLEVNDILTIEAWIQSPGRIVGDEA